MVRPTLTAKQERFCLFIVEGETQSKAYVKAGYSAATNQIARINSTRLLATDNVSARVRELQSKALTKSIISVETLTARLLEIDKAATADGQHSAATGALALAARLHGLLVEHKQVDIMHHKPAPLPTKQLELTEDEWKRQFEKKP
jgi:phage terminase small subunit